MGEFFIRYEKEKTKLGVTKQNEEDKPGNKSFII